MTITIQTNPLNADYEEDTCALSGYKSGKATDKLEMKKRPVQKKGIGHTLRDKHHGRTVSCQAKTLHSTPLEQYLRFSVLRWRDL